MFGSGRRGAVITTLLQDTPRKLMPAAARQPPHGSSIELSATLDFMLATWFGNGAAWRVATLPPIRQLAPFEKVEAARASSALLVKPRPTPSRRNVTPAGSYRVRNCDPLVTLFVPAHFRCCSHHALMMGAEVIHARLHASQQSLRRRSALMPARCCAWIKLDTLVFVSVVCGF
jgi:hypothetical protein